MAQAASQNHIVSVGAGGALAYSPNNVVAAVGDTITFQFLAGVTFLPPHLHSANRIRITRSHNPHSLPLVCPSTVYSPLQCSIDV